MDIDMDMDNPFYRFHPTRPRYYYPPSSTIEATPSRKVISIPVHYVGSDKSQLSQLDSAVKIQKVFRGFLVRKSVKKILEIRNEVNEIEKRISMKETVELIKKDVKERLKVNEMLMSLLFKLDSVRGVDSGVRDCRKAVIKKAIRLQEIVDEIVAENLEKIGEEDENQTLDSSSNVVVNENQTVELQNQNQVEDDECSESEEERQSQADSSANPDQSLIEGDHENDDVVDEDNNDDSLKNNENGAEIKSQKEEQKCGEGRSRELLEKMMEDNEKMMGLMAELFERNEMQTRLLTSLSQRVEQLERALMCEKLKKKKKKRNATAGLVVDCLESTQDLKKSGKR